jgi:Flp pilus assembly protein TadG
MTTSNIQFDRSCSRNRRGSVFLYVAALAIVFAAIVSLAVDLGRVQMAKTELRRAADAASRAGLSALATSTTQARSAAVSMAAVNTADGKSVVIDPNLDVDLGTWDGSTRTFTVLTGSAAASANSVRVTARRTTARGNPLSLTFAPVIGLSSCDVTAVSVAARTPGGFGVIGLNFISMSGNATDSYWDGSGTTTGKNGSIASNGTITLGGSSSIQGDAHPGIGQAVSGASSVSGSTSPLTTVLSYANGSAGSYATANDDGSVPTADMSGNDFTLGNHQSLTLPGGHYVFNNFSIAGTASLTFSGPATIYCYGTFNMNGGTSTYGNLPGNLSIVMIPNPTTGAAPGALNIGGNNALYANFYAPQSAITMSGTGDFYGSMVGLSVSMTGTSYIHYDMSLSGTDGIAIVQ